MTQAEVSELDEQDYQALPWRDLHIGRTVGGREASLLSTVHRLLTDRPDLGGTVDERLRQLGKSVGDVYSGLTADDGQRLADEWSSSLSDLSGRGPAEVAAWAVLFGEGTGGWWPSRSSRLSRGVVNAVVRSEYVEELHRSDRTTFLDNQLGTMALLWAATSLVDPVLAAEPTSWGCHASTSSGHFSTAATLFPGGLAVIRSLDDAARAEDGTHGVVWPTDVDDVGALAWLRAHAGVHSNASHEVLGSPVSVRSGWSPPSTAELDMLAESPVLVLPNMTRLSRDPIHLAALIEWSVATHRTIVTPNVMLTSSKVHVRHRFVPSPVPNATGGHEASWTDVSGLSEEHAEVLRLVVSGRTKPAVGRNQPCPCGSGRKYKHCHG